MEPAHSQTMTPNLPWSLLGGAEVDLSFVDVETHVRKYLTIKFVPYKINHNKILCYIDLHVRSYLTNKVVSYKYIFPNKITCKIA